MNGSDNNAGRMKHIILALFLAVSVFVTGACGSAANQKQQKLSRTIVKRCTNAWDFVTANRMIPDDIEPEDCSWLYAQYTNRNDVTSIKEGEEKYYKWMPDAGYAVCIGKLAMLFNSVGEPIAYYLDDDHTALYTGTKFSEDLVIMSIRMMEETQYKLAMLSLRWRALFPVSFDEYDIEAVPKEGMITFCALKDDQIKQIGQGK